MANYEKMNKLMTPRRAMDKFFKSATPVDSPEMDESFEPPKKLVPHKSVDETHSFQNSVSGNSEFPSSLGSPSLDVRPIPTKKNKKRVPASAFSKAIQSQQSQLVNTSDDLGESTFPSDLGSPDKLLSQRPQRPDPGLVKKSKTLLETQTKASDSDLSDDSDMSELVSSDDSSPSTPMTGPSVEPRETADRPTHQTKFHEKITVPTSISSVSINNSTVEFPSNLNSPQEFKEYNRPYPGPTFPKKRVSTTGFLVALSPQKNDIPLSSESPLKDNDPEEADAESVSSVIKKINRSVRNASRASNKTTTETVNDNTTPLKKLDDSDSDDSILPSTSAIPPRSRSRRNFNFEDEEMDEESSAKSRRLTHSSHGSSKSSSRKSEIGMSPTNRYPALKNSTVVAGGADFGGGPLSMSPIRRSEQGAPTLIISTTKSNASESSKARTAASTNLTSSTSKNVQKTPLHPSTPAPFARKRKHSITQSPMFVNLMKSSVNKAISNIQHPQPSTPSTPAPASATPAASRVLVSKIALDQKQLTSTTPALSRASVANIASKGISILNPGKGKSLVKSALDEKAESSGTEWEDEEDDQERPIPRCIAIAFEEIEDRSKDFVPLEKRLKADPVFQAKVKYQRAKVAAQKAEEAAAEAKKKAAKKKPRAVSTKKKEEDNITSVAFNKANFRFYAGTKVTKEALDAVHGLVGEWFDFTLDQMENFCIDEGIPSLDSWEDCYKMMKRQGIVKNYMEYSGLCHELLLNDECELLLPTTTPPELYEWRRKAKKEHK
ncbi:proteoglycan 4-like [Daphnia pulicaria]|uniref:proteoglycan 4-like n=1 Tax=Daphnia pulicaria TaxID=35523 RepID=UPI001EEB81B7|nr:proteoglycan 4-like [Daphnia pulicaria]XP_046633386.1 proteoglycan 4-like [Daphnia pulicaria]